jgi:hypothetical protein
MNPIHSISKTATMSSPSKTAFPIVLGAMTIGKPGTSHHSPTAQSPSLTPSRRRTNPDPHAPRGFRPPRRLPIPRPR